MDPTVAIDMAQIAVAAASAGAEPTNAITGAGAAAVSAICGLLAGAALMYKQAKVKALKVANLALQNTSAAEIAEIYQKIQDIKDRKSDGGADVTTKELIELGNMIYKSAKD
jgi:acyl-coenzyme A synthetase/AMP-(fatty) acid ligase